MNAVNTHLRLTKSKKTVNKTVRARAHEKSFRLNDRNLFEIKAKNAPNMKTLFSFKNNRDNNEFKFKTRSKKNILLFCSFVVCFAFLACSNNSKWVENKETERQKKTKNVEKISTAATDNRNSNCFSMSCRAKGVKSAAQNCCCVHSNKHYQFSCYFCCLRWIESLMKFIRNWKQNKPMEKSYQKWTRSLDRFQ